MNFGKSLIKTVTSGSSTASQGRIEQKRRIREIRKKAKKARTSAATPAPPTAAASPTAAGGPAASSSKDSYLISDGPYFSSIFVAYSNLYSSS